jgi:PAS domain S-box-containing protein
MPSILIVEDHPESLEYLSTLLRYHDYTVSGATSAAAGLSIARAERPDLVISDVLMPDCDGYEFTRMLRAEAETAQIPVIFWTASYGQRGSAILLAENFGVECVLAKPTEPDELLETVARVLKKGLRAPRPAPTAVQEQDHKKLLTNEIVIKEKEIDAAILRLRTSEAQYRALFEGNPLPMWVIAATPAKVLAVNDAALRHFGYSRQEFLEGGPDQMLVPDGDGEERRYRTKAHREIVGRVTRQALVFDGHAAWAEAFHDLTELIQKGQRLRDLCARLGALQEDLTHPGETSLQMLADEVGAITAGIEELMSGNVGRSRSRAHA